MKTLFKFNQRALKLVLASTLALGAATMSSSSFAGTSSSTVTVGATLVAACQVTPTATINFGSVTNLLSAGDQTADSGVTFQVACSSDASPEIFSATTRTMVNGGHTLPFSLSLTSGAGSDDFPTSAGTALSLTQDGTLKTVVLYAKFLAADFTGGNALPSVAYTRNLTVSVSY
jgi:spore coat protein U-like protein